MKIYIVQANYEDIDPEGRYNPEDDGYESVVYQCQDIIGIYPTLEDAKRGVGRAIKDDVWNNPSEKDFNIIVVDTEKIGDNGFLLRNYDRTRI